MKFKKGDNVVVIAGKDLGKKGDIIAIDRKGNTVVVSGINKVKKHVKKSDKHKGGIVEMEKPLNASNVMIQDPKTQKPTRIGYRKTEQGKKERYAKTSGVILDKPVPSVKNKK